MLSRTQLSQLFSFRTSLIILSLIFFVVILFLIQPELRHKAREWYRGSDRKILATLSDALDGTGRVITVFKIKENGQLFLEFYAHRNDKEVGKFSASAQESTTDSSNGSLELIQKMQLPNPIDGFVTFMGSATNLAVANLDGDNILEILVPSFNLEFAASLDVVKYNAASNRFELMTSYELPESLWQGLHREGD